MLAWVTLMLSLSALHAVAAVVFEDCGSAYDLQAVDIEGCGMRMPCYVTLGENVPVSLTFRASFDSRRLDQNVVININQINLRTDVTPELCDSAQCPVEVNVLNSIKSVMTVPVDIALNQRGFLRWRIYNEQGMMVLCYSVVVQTQNTFQKMLRKALRDQENPDVTYD